MGPEYSNLSAKDRKTLELLLIEDDFFDSMKSIIGKVSNTVQPYLRPAL
jgi:hypothetical protein